MAKSTIYQDIYKSDELAYHLNDVICEDDKCDLTDLSHDTIISETKYVLSKYIGNIGFGQQEDFEGENGEAAYAEAKQNVKAILAFLRKWDK
jgi:hypothetical protein